MKVFRKKGEITRFQILAEIAKEEPHLRQKDIANKLGITVQAVSENIKSLVDDGFVATGKGHANYKITKRGIEKVKKEAVNLRKYADKVLEIMNTYKSIWPAIACHDYKSGEKVYLEMDEGTLYAVHHKTPAYAEVLRDVKKGRDVALINLGGTIQLETGNVVVIKLPPVSQGGSGASDLKKIRKIINDFPKGFDRIGIMGTVSRAVAEKIGIKVDFEFATPYATVAAAKRGLNVLVFAVGRMTKSITHKLDYEGVNYIIEDVKKNGN